MKERLQHIGHILFLQFAVMVYSVNTVVAKYVASEPWFSVKFFLLYALEFAVLGVYAILWQQIIKRVELSVAYANKSMTLLWSLLWGALLFQEGVTFRKALGVLIVIVGTVILNTSAAAPAADAPADASSAIPAQETPEAPGHDPKEPQEGEDDV